MEEKDKELLLQDISGRLPYKVYINDRGTPHRLVNICWDGIKFVVNCSPFGTGHGRIGTPLFDGDICYIKPYLRPLSSMTEEEAKELLFVRLQAKYGTSCAYIKNFIKLNEVSFREKSPYEGSIAVWFSFENKIHDTPQIREYSKCEYLGQINNITLAEIDWLNKKMFDFRGLIPAGYAISTEEFNPYVED